MVVVHLDDVAIASAAIRRAIGGSEIAWHTRRRVASAELPSQALDVVMEAAPAVGLIAERYLDRCLILSTTLESNVRQELLDGFFDVIAPDYATLTDRKRNAANVEGLVRLLEIHTGLAPGHILLDFGAGDGISVGVDAVQPYNLVGVEHSAEMALRARQRGLRLATLSELKLTAVTIGGCFSSYVLHLSPDADDVRQVWELLPAGCGFAANFHKDQGLAHTHKILSSSGRLAAAWTVLGSAHGTQAVFLRT